MSIFVRVVGSERGKSVCEGGAEITHWTLCLLGPHYRRYGVLGGNVSEVFGFGDLDVEASRMGHVRQIQRSKAKIPETPCS